LILIPRQSVPLFSDDQFLALAPQKIRRWAVAIGFPELVAVFMQTSMNQTGRAIEIIFHGHGFIYSSACWISYLLKQVNDSVGNIKVR